MNYIAFDAHKRYTLASVERAEGEILREVRVGHERGAIRKFLLACEPGSPVVVETIGNWYWIVDEIEEAGMVARPGRVYVAEGRTHSMVRLDGATLAIQGRIATGERPIMPAAAEKDSVCQYVLKPIAKDSTDNLKEFFCCLRTMTLTRPLFYTKLKAGKCLIYIGREGLAGYPRGYARLADGILVAC